MSRHFLWHSPPTTNQCTVKCWQHPELSLLLQQGSISQTPWNVLNKILEVEVCILVLFPVLVYSVRQSSLLFPLSCLSKTSWSHGQAGDDLKTLFLCWFSHPAIPWWGVSTAAFTYLSQCWNDSMGLTESTCASLGQSILPAVLCAIGKGQTRSVVNTGRVIIHTLQSCKRKETS